MPAIKHSPGRRRVLVLGADGMLGHQVMRRLAAAHEVKGTLRRDRDAYHDVAPFNQRNAYFGIDVREFARVERVARAFRPNAIVNAVGIVKQRSDDPVLSIEINSLFPHRLAELCRRIDARLVHVSTDCVFTGTRGAYVESDAPDPQDLYGRSKLLGEVGYSPGITLRTSMIGPEIFRKGGLLEWFIARRGAIQGYRNAVFSGFTTIELARVIERTIVHRSAVHGIFHVSAAPISKFELLSLIKRKMELAVRIEPDDGVHIDRSLNSRTFRRRFDYRPPSWEAMIGELAIALKKE